MLYMRANLFVHGKSQECFLVLPKRTHHVDELEIVCAEDMRKKFDLRDGDVIEVTLGVE